MASPRELRMARTAAIAGTVLLAVIALVLYLAATAHTGAPWKSTTTVKAAFEDVDSLNPGDEVRQNSVRIGKVSSVDFVDDQAVVTLELDGDRTIYRNARATVWDYTALGTKFINLDPGTPDAGKLGDSVIPASRNVDSADMYKVLNTLDKRTRLAASRGIRNLGGGMAGRGQDLHDFLGRAPDLLTDLGSVSHALASKRANLPAMLRSADRLSARFAGREKQLAELMEQSDATLRAFSVDGGRPLQDTINELPGTLRTAHASLDKLDEPLADTEAAFSKLRAGSKALGESTPDLRGLLRESVRPLERLSKVAGQAEPAVADLTKMISDARPLAPRFTNAMSSAVTPLRVLAPYAPEAGQLFVRGHSFLAAGAALPGLHYARLGVTVGAGQVTGSLIEGDGLKRNVYPEPGEASHDRAGLPAGGTR